MPRRDVTAGFFHILSTVGVFGNSLDFNRLRVVIYCFLRRAMRAKALGRASVKAVLPFAGKERAEAMGQRERWLIEVACQEQRKRLSIPRVGSAPRRSPWRKR